MKNRFTIRRMNLEEVETIAIDWAAAEGWNPGLNDALCFYNTDPKGFFIGLLNNEPVACISAVSYDDTFAFIGFYIVHPDHRGKGFGIKIWNAAMSYIQDQNMGLDGVIEQQKNYMKSGFQFAYSNIRFEGTNEYLAYPDPDIVELTESVTPELIKYDSELFPGERARFLNCWVKQENSSCFIYLQLKEILGYCVIRKCQTGYKIGPLFANSVDVAKQLFLKAVSSTEAGSKIYLDVPDVNRNAVQLAESWGMREVFRTARMYTKTEPDLELNRIYGVTTFELG